MTGGTDKPGDSAAGKRRGHATASLLSCFRSAVASRAAVVRATLQAIAQHIPLHSA